MSLLGILIDFIKECLSVIIKDSGVDESSRAKISRFLKHGFIALVVTSYLSLLAKIQIMDDSHKAYKASQNHLLEQCLAKNHSESSSDVTDGTGFTIPSSWSCSYYQHSNRKLY